MDPSQVLLIVAAAVVMGWFALGVVINIRRGNAVLRWMQAGLPRLGQRARVRWLGSSAVELVIDKARPPFRSAEVVLVLEPRDVPWLWLGARSRGRRDMLIVRGRLERAPQFEYDVLAPGSWSARERLARAQGREWESEPLSGAGSAQLRAPAATRALARRLAPGVWQAAQQVSPSVWRLSSRREAPQLEVHVALPDPRRDDAAAFFAALRTLAERASAARAEPA